MPTDRPTLWVLTPDAVEHMERRWPWLIRKATDTDLLAALAVREVPYCIPHEQFGHDPDHVWDFDCDPNYGESCVESVALVPMEDADE